MHFKPSRTRKAGWTLIEIMVVIGVMSIIIAIAIAALSTSKPDSLNTARSGTAKTINEAIVRAYLKGDTNSLIYGESADDVASAVNYLTAQGYLR